MCGATRVGDGNNTNLKYIPHIMSLLQQNIDLTLDLGIYTELFLSNIHLIMVCFPYVSQFYIFLWSFGGNVEKKLSRNLKS